MEPQLGLGLWNAWPFFVLYWLPMPVLQRARPDVLRLLNSGEPTAGEKRRRVFIWLLLLVGFVYALFLPLQVGTPWFYVGMSVALAGLALFGSAVREMVAWPDLNRPLTSGAYRFSRHPMYVGAAIMFIGVGVACTSVLFVLYSVVSFAAYAASAGGEESECLEHYGAEYSSYLARTPRWLGFPRRDEAAR